MLMNGKGGCRFGWHPRILAFFVTAALGLSITSSLDCNFLVIDLGFIPPDYYSEALGFGLWSYTAPGGRCLSYKESSQSSGKFSVGDDLYSNFILNGDVKWTVSRLLAMVTSVFGVVSLISIWINVCQSEPHLVDVLAYSTTTAFMSECSKFGLFLLTDLCRSPDYWYSNESNEFSGSKSCGIDRGAFMSIGSICAYLVSMVLAVGFAARPKGDFFNHDEASLPSWMATEHGADAETHAETHAVSTVVSNKNKEPHHHPGSVNYTMPSPDVAPTNANQSSNSPHPRRPNRRITQPATFGSRRTPEPYRRSFSSQSQQDRPNRRLAQSAVLERPRRSTRSIEQSNLLERPDRTLLQPFNPSHLAAIERHRRISIERANSNRRLPQSFNPSRIERPNRRTTQSTELTELTEQSTNSQVEDYKRHRRSAQSTTRSCLRSNDFGANGSYIIEDHGMHPGHFNNFPCNSAPMDDCIITNEDFGMETMEEYDMVNVPLPKEGGYMDPMQICREEEHMDPIQVCRQEEYPHPALDFPPTENARRTYDECSEMTWDAGY